MIVVLHSTPNLTNGDPLTGVTKLIAIVISKLSFGVPMFFVISGYCIAATCDSARRKPRASASFFYRRFRRIFPPYWVTAALCIALAVVLTAVGQGDLVSTDYGLIPHPSRLTLSQWFGNLTLTELWRPNLFGSPELKIVGPSWTLCYEEQFYAVCGLLLSIAPRRFFSGVVAITLLTLVVAPLGFLGITPSIRGFFFDSGWLLFAEGVAVYYALCLAPSSRPWIIFFAVVLVALAVARWGVPAVAADDTWRRTTLNLVGVTAFALVLLLLHPWDARLLRSPLARPFAVCGQMCYSLYLIHWPVTVLVTAAFFRAGYRSPLESLLVVAPIALGLSIAAGWVFHVYVERRFLNAPLSPVAPQPTALADQAP